MTSSVKERAERMTIYMRPSYLGDTLMCAGSEKGEGLRCRASAVFSAELGWCDTCKSTESDCFVNGHPRRPSEYFGLCDVHAALMRTWPALVSIRSINVDA